MDPEEKKSFPAPSESNLMDELKAIQQLDKDIAGLTIDASDHTFNLINTLTKKVALLETNNRKKEELMQGVIQNLQRENAELKRRP